MENEKKGTLTEAYMKVLEEARAKAKEIFTAYSDIDEIYITSDMQGFTDEIRAENHADKLKDKQIHHFYRFSDFEEKTQEDEEREDLLEEYEQLFNSKPPHNISTKKLKEKISAKKKELDNQEGKQEAETGGEPTSGDEEQGGDEVVNEQV